MSYRFFNPAPVFMDLLGLRPLAGGSLAFYELGTTTPKGTWSDPDLTIPNTNPVQLDSSGRANVNVWLDGGYSVRLLDALGATVWTRDVNDGAGGGAAIPSLQTGQFLTNDGANLLWDTVRQPPDPAGSTDYILSTDGSNLIWIPQPTIPDVPITTTNTSVKVKDMLDQWGTGNIPASGTKFSSVTINFPTPYIAAPDVKVQIARGNGVVAAGFLGCLGVSSVSNNGFTVVWDLNLDNVGSQFNLTAPIPISWRAIGKVAS